MQARWLLRLIRSGDDAAFTALAAIPESVVRDMASWLTFVIQWGAADLLGGVPIGDLVGACANMLHKPRLVRSPIVLAKVVTLLQSMLAPQLDPRRRALGGKADSLRSLQLVSTAQAGFEGQEEYSKASRCSEWQEICSFPAQIKVTNFLFHIMCWAVEHSWQCTWHI